RFTGESEHPAFEGNCTALQECGVRKAECKTFDLVTVSGESAMAAFEAVKPFLRDGSVVAVFDTGMDAMQPECRLLWHTHRKSQTVILHTHEQGVGVFIVKNMTAMGVTNVRADVQKPVVGESKEATPTPLESAGVSSEGPEGREEPGITAPGDPTVAFSRKERVGPIDLSGHPMHHAVVAPPKRRGRPPTGVKA